MGIDATCRLLRKNSPFRWLQRDFQRIHDLQCHLVLNREDIRQIAVIAFGPNMRCGSRVDQLRRDAHPVARPTD